MKVSLCETTMSPEPSYLCLEIKGRVRRKDKQKIEKRIAALLRRLGYEPCWIPVL